jgi:hypothetical protein
MMDLIVEKAFSQIIPVQNGIIFYVKTIFNHYMKNILQCEIDCIYMLYNTIRRCGIILGIKLALAIMYFHLTGSSMLGSINV